MTAKELPRYEVSRGIVDHYIGWYINRISDGHIEKVHYAHQVAEWVHKDCPGSVHIIWYDDPDEKKGK